MAKDTLKDLREKAEELVAGGIKNQEALYEALPILTDLQFKAAIATKVLAGTVKIGKMLSEMCSKYAMAHESVFKNRQLIKSQQGVLVGDVVRDEATYHFAAGFNGYERDDGQKMTREFLKSLPEGWTKTELKISTTGINAAMPDEEELSVHHLRQKCKNEWSVAQEV